jgi:hypothetical protein
VHLRKPDLSQDPRKYESPERLLCDPGLSHRAKRALLRHWKSDLALLLSSTDEFTPSAAHADETDAAELLHRVSNCLLQLDSGRQITASRHHS